MKKLDIAKKFRYNSQSQVKLLVGYYEYRTIVVIFTLEHFLRMSALFDFYGVLLTDTQRRYMEMHFLEDLSLSEIATRIGVSRQAVHDIVHRSEQLLEEYEEKLKLLQHQQADQERVAALMKELMAVADQIEETQARRVRQVSEEIIKLLGRSKEA